MPYARVEERRAKVRRAQMRNKRIIDLAKAQPCARCGESFPPVCMDFHHRDPATKRFNLGGWHSKGVQTILDEIEKCDVLCSNCHRIVEYGKDA